MISDRSTNPIRLQFLDLLKIVAIFLVIFYHSSPTMAELSADPYKNDKYLQYFLHGLTSIAVPVFFVVNGYLTLNKTLKLNRHLAKTLRIYLLTLVWSFITVIAISKIENEKYTNLEIIRAALFLKQNVNNHLWFLFALVSIYIFLPVVKVAYDYHDTRIIRWMLLFLFVFSFGNLFGNWCLNVLYIVVGHRIDITEAGDIKEHIPFSSQSINQFQGFYWAWVYFIIGGFLGRRDTWCVTFAPNLLQLGGVFVASLLILFAYGLVVSPSLDSKMFDTGWDGYYSIPTLLMTISIFLAFRQIPYVEGKIADLISSAGTNTLGIYFTHMIVIKILNPFVYQLSFSFVSVHILYTAFILLYSWAMTLVLRRTPLMAHLFKL